MKDNKYKCKHCRGIASINKLKDTDKATIPSIEFCPFCGMSNFYPRESEKISDKITETAN